MKFFRNVMGTFFAEILIVVLQFLLGVLAARLLPTSERGILALVMLLPVTLAYIFDFGISQSIVYLIGRKKYAHERVLGNALSLALLVGGLAAFGLWLLRAGLARELFQGLSPQLAGWVILALPLALLDAYLLSFLRARQEFFLFNFRRFVTPVITLAAFLALVVFGGYGLDGAILAFLIGLAISLGLVLWIVRRRARIHLHLDGPLAREAFSFGLKSYLQNLVGHLHYRLDVYLLALLLPPEQVAFYVVATSLAEAVFYLPNSVGLVLFPRLAIEKDNQIHILTAEAVRHTLWITSTIVLGLLLGGWLLIPLIYGEDYQPAITPLMILLPGVLAMSIYKVLTRNFTSRNRQQVSIIAAGLALAANSGINLIVIPSLGVTGAAAASSISYTLAAIILLVVFHRESGISIANILVVQRRDFQKLRQMLTIQQLNTSGDRKGRVET